MVLADTNGFYFCADLLKPYKQEILHKKLHFGSKKGEPRGRKVEISKPTTPAQRKASRRPALDLLQKPFTVPISNKGSQLPPNRQAFSTSPSPDFARKKGTKHQGPNETVEAISHLEREDQDRPSTSRQLFMTFSKKHRDLKGNKGRTGAPGGKKDPFVLELDSLFA
ncbi:hypothetical protein GWK47_039648 [Chionoecetes opilio]|uniref:Uncharacterized protein n=1 Tax=Chionoecetes opilio TaxID=41210 RepID=A0A8J4YBC7_CHIOP|nr:hypothetical protein GWK47_039648 [Chionoecetes opilio]